MINIPNDKNLSLHNYYSNHSSSTQSKSILYSSHHRKWKKNPSQVFKNTSVDNTTPVDNTLKHIILRTDLDPFPAITRTRVVLDDPLLRVVHPIYPLLGRNSPGSREKSASVHEVQEGRSST